MKYYSTIEHLTKAELARRWSVGKRTLDRLRKLGQLPWVDLSGGYGKKPIVRFRLADVENFELSHAKSISAESCDMGGQP